MIGRLTTHVLDTARGRPISDITIALWRLGIRGEERQLLKTVRTNADGRTDKPLLVGDEMATGVYELVFFVGPYFAEQGLVDALTPFLNQVPVRIGIADAQAHYHVPLLASPWGYTTYRGS
jgi:5-hydroxyisourate hydrolase